GAGAQQLRLRTLPAAPIPPPEWTTATGRPKKRGTLVKLSKARLEPIPEIQWSDKVKETLREIKVGQGGVPNIFKTLAHHPDLMLRWLVFGNHVLFKSTVPARERELVILRIGWLCEA